MLASASGTGSIFGVLDEKLLDKLFAQSRNARADNGAITELCDTLEAALKTFRIIRDEYYHRLEIEAERDDAEQRLQDAINAIHGSPRPE